MSQEDVYCIPRHLLKAAGLLPTAVLPLSEPAPFLDLEHRFVPRDEAETDPSYKQIIPYQVFAHQGEILVFARGKAVGEQRLAGRLSLGIGGHINSDDCAGNRMSPGCFQKALLRERHEELVITGPVRTRFLGLINDDSDQVGQVHLGAVFACVVTDPADVSLRAGSEDLHFQGWWPASVIREQAARFETWSLLALELYGEGSLV